MSAFFGIHRRMNRRFPALLVGLLVPFFAFCGEPTDNPEDCTDGQYFDQVRKLCFTCPALRVPECTAGCGFVIRTNEDDGCPESDCVDAQTCDLCTDDEFFSDASLQCEACIPVGESCPDDEPPVPVIADDVCTLRCE